MLVLAGFGPALAARAASTPGTVTAWGDYAGVPAGLSNVLAVSAGGEHNLALKADGTVVNWGQIYSYVAKSWVPISVPSGLSGVVAISAGDQHSLALKSDGTVVAWGENSAGQTDVPSSLTDVVAIAAGRTHNVALKSDGTIVTWGSNAYGAATVPSGLTDVKAIAAGFHLSLALKRDGTVVAWGYGASEVPSGLSGVTAIATDAWHSLALKSDGTVVEWGQIWSFATNSYVPVPGPPMGLSGVTAIAAGYFHSVALKQDGTVVVWGDNSAGQTNVPSGLSRVTAIAAGGYHSLALVAPADSTPPVITPTVTGNLGSNSWYTSDVSVTWAVTDPESTVSTSFGCGDQRVTADTAGVTLTCTATSVGGTSSQAVTIKRDATPPTLAPAVSPVPVVLNGTATAAANATDPTSGVAASGCDTVATGEVGTFTLDCHATDLAGNRASTTAPYRVDAPFETFRAPMSKTTFAKSGSSIPVKFTLRDANGPLSPETSQMLAANGQVRVGLTATSDASGIPLASAPCTWDTTYQQFACVLKTPTLITITNPYFITVQEAGSGGSDWSAAPTIPGTTGAAVNPVEIGLK